jgi:hypothetical protein
MDPADGLVGQAYNARSRPTVRRSDSLHPSFARPIDCACAVKGISFPQAMSDGTASDPALEAIMKKEIFQENKARWEVFEWMGSTQTKIIWAVGAAIVVLGIVYLLS